MQTVPSPIQKTSSRPADGSSIFPAGYMLAFALTTVLFFVWGMSNNLTDILVQQFKKSFELSLIQAQLVQTSNFLAYAVMAAPAALLMRRFGYKAGLVVGLVTFAIGTLLFWPAAIIGQYTSFLIALFVVGSGASILETAANPLIAQLGSPASSEQRLNFAQAFNPPGTILGVLFGTWFIFSGVEKTPQQIENMKAAGTYATYLHTEILRVVPTYVCLGIAVLILAGFLSRARFPANLDANLAGSDAKPSSSTGAAYLRLLSTPTLMFAVAAQFFYVGAQVATWSTLIPYLKAYTTLGDKTGGYFVAGTLVALAIGRIVSTYLMRFIRPSRMMALYAVANILLLIVGILRPGMSGAVAILLTSFFMSIMYPTIFAMGVRGLGEETKLGSSLLVMAIIGGAIFPPLMGVVARITGSLAYSFALPAVAYIFVLLYALADRRVGEVNLQTAPY